MKRCSHCEIEKSFSEFHKDKTRRDGHNPQCKTCRSSPEKLAQRRIYWKTNTRTWDSYYYKKRYGITIEEKEMMVQRQKGLCACCGKPFVSKLFTCVDHDHKTNKVRKILCRECNLILGYANDDIEILQKVITYLKNHLPT